MAAWLDANENKKSVEGDFGPSLKEYNPDISIEEWI